jgi:hypothetical protein
MDIASMLAGGIVPGLLNNRQGAQQAPPQAAMPFPGGGMPQTPMQPAMGAPQAPQPMSMDTNERPTDMARRYAAALMSQNRPPAGFQNVMNTAPPYAPSQQQPMPDDRMRAMLAQELAKTQQPQQPQQPQTYAQTHGLPAWAGLMGL